MVKLQPRALCIISGGQTGADRAALDWAIAHQLPHGGWCPQGRRAEGGAIPACYGLRETRSVSYRVRTRRNVEAADATVLFTLGRALSEGTRYTAHVARRLGKPLLHLHKSGGVARSATLLDRFLERYPVAVLNIAGPRASQQPAIASFVQAVLTRARPLKGCGCSVPRGSLPQDVAGRRVTRHCRYAVVSFLSRSK